MVGDVVILEVMRGRTPEHSDLERVADTLLASEEAPHVITDLSDLDFIPSALMARLVALNKRIQAAEGRLILCGMQPVVQTAFQDARLHKVFEIHADEQAALATLS
jgi:anti-sigma B factor antagonist